MMNSGKKLNPEHKYQVWITSYPLNGASEASKYDPGYQLIGMHEHITAAVLQADDNKSYKPMITKTVTYKTVITDITDIEEYESKADEKSTLCGCLEDYDG